MVSNSAQKEEGLSGESVSETEKKKQCCSDCKVTRTPCWRNGPSGPKTLCNACGLKYAKKKKRTRGKKEVMVPLEKGVLNRGLLLLPGVVKKKQRSPRRHWSEVERAALLLMSLSSSSSSSFSGARFSERIFYPGSFVSHLT